MVLGLAFGLVLTAILVLVMGLAHIQTQSEVVTECIAAIEESEVEWSWPTSAAMRVFGQTLGEPIRSMNSTAQPTRSSGWSTRAAPRA